MIRTFPYTTLRFMPLSPAAPRARAHRRVIELDGFMREDGFLEMEACLRDTKDRDYPIASGVRKAGEPVHELRIRIRLDAQFTILDVEAVSDHVPYPSGCDTIGPAYRRLVGLNLLRGFRKTVGEMFAGVAGCSHMTELLYSIPTAAIQTMASFQKDTGEEGKKPFQLDRCHALETTSETVRRYYPRWYRHTG
jgi:hypothetical protein